MTYDLQCFPSGQALPQILSDSRRFASILATAHTQPRKVFSDIVNHESPLVHAEALALALALVCWLWYIFTKTCSHVDRMWSIAPIFYVYFFARDDICAATNAVREALVNVSTPLSDPASWAPRLAAARAALASSGADPRLLAAFALTAAWGSRLTFNFWRKGGYSLWYEDYRWAEVRKLMSPFLFEVFNLVFVALAQHLLCLLITLPAFAAKLARGSPALGGALPPPPPPMGPADWAAAAAFAVLLAGETVSDQQQWAFQSRKHRMIAEGAPRSGDFRRGFRTSGLFRFSRHPSFFFEYAIWWSLYVLCAVLPYRCLVGPAAAGAVGLTFLFHGGSLWITERITAGRYPAYGDYQRTTSAIVLWWPGPPLPDRAE